MIVLFVTALVLSALLLLALLPVAVRLKLLAVPGEHRLHESSTPLTGGIAIFLSLVVTGSVFSLEIPWSLLAAMTLVFVFGVVDDRWTVPFCPMLSQGWGYLRAFDVVVPDAIESARRFLKPGLWTTFGPEGMDIIEAFARTQIR